MKRRNGGPGPERLAMVDAEARVSIDLVTASLRALTECLVARGAILGEDVKHIMARRDEIVRALAQGRDLPPPNFPKIILPA